jgi:uncharacterized membrane protein
MGVYFTPLSLACTAIALAATLANFIFVGMRFGDLPAQVPRHYGFTGKPDAWSGKGVIWVYPAMPFVMLAAMTCAAIVTAHNMTGDELRTNIRQMSLISAFLSVLTLGLTLRTVAVAEKRAEGLGRMFLPVFIVVFVSLMIVLRK